MVAVGWSPSGDEVKILDAHLAIPGFGNEKVYWNTEVIIMELNNTILIYYQTGVLSITQNISTNTSLTKIQLTPKAKNMSHDFLMLQMVIVRVSFMNRSFLSNKQQQQQQKMSRLHPVWYVI